MKKLKNYSSFRHSGYSFILECYILMSPEKERLMIPRNIYRRGAKRMNSYKIRNPIILVVDGNAMLFTVNEMQKIQNISEFKDIEDAYKYDQKYRFIKEYPVQRMASQWAERQVTWANNPIQKPENY